MRRALQARLRMVLPILLLAGLALATPPLCGWLSAGPPGRLSWEQARRLFPPGRAGGRVLAAWLRNDSARPVVLKAEEIRLLDGDGGEVPVTVELLGRPVSRRGRSRTAAPPAPPPSHRARVPAARVEPGYSVALRVAWRRPEQLTDAPVWLQYGAGSLVLP